MRRVMQKLARAFGYEVSRNRYGYFKELFKNNKFDHLIDVGANRGQFLSFIKSTGYFGAATAFEPIAEYREEIERLGDVRVFANAVGKARGSVEMNVYSSTDFSSFYRLNNRYTREYPSALDLTEIRQIDVVTLDEFDISGSNIFLKGTSNNCHRSPRAPNLPTNDSALFSFRFCAVHPKDLRDSQLRQLFEVP
jgi:FkbM family methyltransferase